MQYILYKNETGQPTRTIIANDLESVKINLFDGESYIEHNHQVNIDEIYIHKGKLLHKGRPPFAGATFCYKTQEWIDIRTVAEARAKKWAEIKVQRDEKLREPFFYNGKRYAPDMQNIAFKNQAAMIDPASFSTIWITYDNEPIELDAKGIKELLLTLEARQSKIFHESQLLRRQIESCKTNAEVDLLAW